MSFRFKQFEIEDDRSTMKVCTDSVLLGAWADCKDCKNVLDVGTGCGILALMLAQRSNAEIEAVEVDEDSVIQAKGNFEKSAWNKRIRIVGISFPQYAEKCTKKFDLVISNPPYFENSLKPESGKRSLARHVETLSFQSLIENVVKCMNHHGRFACVLPYPSSLKMISTASLSGLKLKRQLNISTNPHSSPKLVLLEFEIDFQGDGAIDELSIYDDSGKYSDPYIFLTHHFYLNF